MTKKAPKRAAAAASEPTAAAAAAAPPKKKNKAASLEDQVRVLEEENQALRLQLKVGKESGKHNELEKAELLQKIAQYLKLDPERNALVEENLKAALKSYIVRFSDCSSDHASMVDNHVTQIRRLLAPTKVTRLTLWALNQDDDFFKPTLTPNESLFSIMNNTMEATPDQLEHLKSYRMNGRSLVHKLRYTERACDDLIARLKRKNRALNEELHELQEILTPVQLAKLLIWSNQNADLQHALKKTWAEAEEEEDASQLQSLSAAAAAAAASRNAGLEDDEDEDDD